jgi:hypothetical protein
MSFAIFAVAHRGRRRSDNPQFCVYPLTGAGLSRVMRLCQLLCHDAKRRHCGAQLLWKRIIK